MGEKGASGGIVGKNTGDICDSYAVAAADGGVAGRNSGRLRCCFFAGSGRRVCAHSTGSLTACFNSSLTPHPDALRDAGWDERIWSLNERQLPSFRPDAWHACSHSDEYVDITAAAQLMQLARHINSGNETYLNRTYRLKNDIDLKRRRFIPIGTNEHPFTGVFDGGGYAIRNLCVSANRRGCAGLFGALKDAEILDLTVMGSVQGGSCTGALAGSMTGGRIACCCARADVEGYGAVGVLAGESSGVVDRCCTGGSAAYRKHERGFGGAVVVAMEAVLVVAAVALMALFGRMEQTQQGASLFEPLSADPNLALIGASPSPAAEAPTPSPASPAFECNKRVTFENAGSEGALGFINPTGSGSAMTVELRLTDAAYLEVSGESLPITDSQSGAEYAVLYTSGLIAPGGRIDRISLSTLPGGKALPAGEYKALLHVSFQDPNTGARTADDTTAEIVIAIEN